VSPRQRFSGPAVKKSRQLLVAWLVVLLTAVGLAPGPSPLAAADAAAQVPSCPVGTWRLSEAQLQPALRSRMNPYVVQRSSGDIVVTIKADGSFEIAYQRFAIDLTSDDARFSFMIDGLARGALREADPGTFAISLDSYAVSVAMVRGQEEQAYQIDSLPEMLTLAEYQCAGGLFLNMPIPWPDGNWVRLPFMR